MVFLRKGIDNEEERRRREENGLFLRRDLVQTRQLKHHYILTPIGKPENTTDGKIHDVLNTQQPPVVPGQNQTNATQDTDETAVEVVSANSTETPTGDDTTENDSAYKYDDHDSGEDKIAAMIAEMQAKAANEIEPSAEEDNVDTEEGGDKDGEEDEVVDGADGEELDVDLNVTDTLVDEEEKAVDANATEAPPLMPVDTSDTIDEEDAGVDTDKAEETPTEEIPTEDTIDGGDAEDETISEQSSAMPSEATALPPDANDAPTTTPPDTTNEEPQDGDVDGDSTGNDDTDTDEEPGEADDEQDTTAGEDASEEPLSTPEPGEAETSQAPVAAPSTTANDEQDMVEKSVPTVSSEGSTIPSPVPSSMATAATSVILHPHQTPPTYYNDAGAFTPTDPPVDSLVAAPSSKLPEVEKSHEDAPPPKGHEEQPHSSTTGTSDGPSFAALCRHPNGVGQQINCKLVLGVQSHPVALSAAFLFALVWGCCLCRRMCKGGSRRDDLGEYREVAAQYDDVLFQDTFDDNYSASFADDRSADGSIMSDEEEDDWTKGPNIELSALPRREDDLSLEEMNG